MSCLLYISKKKSVNQRPSETTSAIKKLHSATNKQVAA